MRRSSHRPSSIAATLAVVVGCVAATACAPTRAESPPRPALVPAARPAATSPSTGPATADAPPTSLASTAPTTPTTPTGSATPVDLPEPDPAPSTEPEPTSPPLTGWDAVEQSLRISILGNGSFAGSFAVTADGALVRSVAFGERVPGENDRAEVHDRFRIASISKVITAVVLLQLVQGGAVGLDEPVGERLATALGVTTPGPGVAGLTPEQLLSHTSGMASYERTFFGEGVTPCDVAARQALSQAVGAPGGYRYSNMNYCLAGVLIEQLTGQSYEAAVYERLLTPLGISGMRVAGTYDVGPDEAAHFSRPGRGYMEALGAAGAWIASAADVARIVDSIDPSTPGWAPLAPEVLERMRRGPAPVVDGTSGVLEGASEPPGINGYGLGLILYPDGTVGHTGTLESTHAMVLNRPDGVTWAVLVNGEYPSRSSDLRRIVDRALAAGFPDG